MFDSVAISNELLCKKYVFIYSKISIAVQVTTMNQLTCRIPSGPWYKMVSWFLVENYIAGSK